MPKVTLAAVDVLRETVALTASRFPLYVPAK
jgi:hypothetical protein